MQKAFSTIPNNRQIVDIMSDRRKGWLAALEPEGCCGENINQACPRTGGNQAEKQASPSWMGSDSSWLSPSDAHTPRGKRSQHAAPAPGDPDLERPGRQSTANLHTWLPQSSPGSASLKQERFSGNEPLGACLRRPHPGFVDLPVAATPKDVHRCSWAFRRKTLRNPG